MFRRVNFIEHFSYNINRGVIHAEARHDEDDYVMTHDEIGITMKSEDWDEFSEDERVKAGIAVLSATLLSMQGKHVREYYLSPDALQNRKETIELQKLLGL